jgi:hypothetical protein
VLKPDPFNDNINPLVTMMTNKGAARAAASSAALSARWSPLDLVRRRRQRSRSTV